MDRREVIKVARLRAAIADGSAAAIRQRFGLSFAEAARGGGVSEAAVLRWESRQRVPHGAPAARYMDFLDALQRSAAPQPERAS
jgi:DNA-binding transcriptional regulator YiaG